MILLIPDSILVKQIITSNSVRTLEDVKANLYEITASTATDLNVGDRVKISNYDMKLVINNELQFLVNDLDVIVKL